MPDVKLQHLKRAVIKEEYIAICGDMMEAVILNQMIYWSERVNDFDRFIEEEKKRQALFSDKVTDYPLQCGWIHKSAAELKDEIMSGDSPKTILRKLENLVSKGFLMRRRNPEYAYDHVYQYRVDFCAVTEALSLEGYSLEGYKVELVPEAPADTRESEKSADQSSNNDTALPESQRVHSKGQNVPSSAHFVPSEGHDVPAIPEITTEITSETTSSPSYSPRQRTDEGRTEDGTEAELIPLFDAMGIDRLKRRELIGPMKAVIFDLWRSLRVGRTSVSRDDVKKALSCLSPENIEGIFGKFDRQEKKGLIVAPTEYIKALILNAPQDEELTRLSRQSAARRDDGPSFDIDEFVRLSMEKVDGVTMPE